MIVRKKKNEELQWSSLDWLEVDYLKYSLENLIEDGHQTNHLHVRKVHSRRKRRSSMYSCFFMQ